MFQKNSLIFGSLVFFFTILSFTYEIVFDSFVYTKNCSTFLGLSPNIYGTLGLILLLGLLYLLHKDIKDSMLTSVSLALVIGNSVFHVYQRVIYGCVKDYFTLFNLHFNLNDVLIVIGIVVLFCYNLIRNMHYSIKL